MKSLSGFADFLLTVIPDSDNWLPFGGVAVNRRPLYLTVKDKTFSILIDVLNQLLCAKGGERKDKWTKLGLLYIGLNPCYNDEDIGHFVFARILLDQCCVNL